MAPGAASEDMFVPKDKSSTEGEKKNGRGGGSIKEEFFTLEVLIKVQ